jgi:ferric-dicitrate binding protein FerR (iron transport regulator)
MQDQDVIEDTLLARFLSGEATAEEAMVVNAWIDRSTENKLYYHQLEKAWLLNRKTVDYPSAKAAAWNKLRSSLPPLEKKRVQFFTPYRIAAGLLLVLAAGFGAYFFRSAGPGEVAWNVKQTSNEIINLNLTDGSSVTINRNSRIKWPKELKRDVREVQLEGEAFFDVSHDPSKPFVVATDNIRIKVLGTAFNVSNATAGYIETEVVRGKVMMYNAKSKIIIEAGMTGRYDKTTHEFSLLPVKNENAIAYATHSLSFESATLKEVCEQLTKAYGMQFVFENPVVEHCTLTSEYHNQSLVFIMDVISASLGIKHEIKGDTVFISGDGCR